MKIVKELNSYIKNPDNQRYYFETSVKKGVVFLQVFLICLFVVLLTSSLTGIIRYVFRINFQSNDFPLFYFWAINIMIIPIIEETAYRLPLVYRRLNISLSSLFISYTLISYSFGHNILNCDDGLFIRITVSVIFMCIVYFLLGFENINKRLVRYWSQNQRIIFYIFLIAFTVRHLDTYELSGASIALSPILLLPLFFNGIFLSFIRIRFGFIYSILFHVMINIAAFLPQILLFYGNR